MTLPFVAIRKNCKVCYEFEVQYHNTVILLVQCIYRVTSPGRR